MAMQRERENLAAIIPSVVAWRAGGASVEWQYGSKYWFRGQWHVPRGVLVPNWAGSETASIIIIKPSRAHLGGQPAETAASCTM